jgi:hypothetical protein
MRYKTSLIFFSIHAVHPRHCTGLAHLPQPSPIPRRPSCPGRFRRPQSSPGGGPRAPRRGSPRGRSSTATRSTGMSLWRGREVTSRWRSGLGPLKDRQLASGPLPQPRAREEEEEEEGRAAAVLKPPPAKAVSYSDESKIGRCSWKRMRGPDLTRDLTAGKTQ